MTQMTIIDVCTYAYPGQQALGNIDFSQGLDGIIRIGRWSVPETPEPTTDELEALIPIYQNQFDYDHFDSGEEMLLSMHIDSVAKEKRYDSAASCATYIHSEVAQWKSEATAFIAWRDAVYTYFIEQEALMEQGQRPIPTFDAFKAELPAMIWPNK